MRRVLNDKHPPSARELKIRNPTLFSKARLGLFSQGRIFKLDESFVIRRFGSLRFLSRLVGSVFGLGYSPHSDSEKDDTHQKSSAS